MKKVEPRKNENDYRECQFEQHFVSFLVTQHSIEWLKSKNFDKSFTNSGNFWIHILKKDSSRYCWRKTSLKIDLSPDYNNFWRFQFQCRNRVDSFSTQYSLSSREFSVATLVIYVKPVVMDICEFECKNFQY